RIRELVGMDYTTFVNSAFLLQGRADEFTTKPPAERKRVLGEILGLGLYDRLQERARQKSREQTESLQRVRGELDARAQSAALRPEHEAELSRLVIDLESAAADLKAAEGDVAKLRSRAEQLRGRARELVEQESRVTDARGELDGLSERIVRHGRQIEDWVRLVADEERVGLEYARLVELRSQDAAFGQLLGPYNRLAERKAGLERSIAALPELREQRDAAQRRLDELRHSWDELSERRRKLEEINVSVFSLRGENQRLRRDMDELRDKVDRLEEGDERCPLCGTELGVEGKQHIVAEYETQGKAYAESYRKNAAALVEMEPQHQALQKETASSEEELTRADRDVHSAIAALTGEIDRAGEDSASVAPLQQELDQLGYDPEAHRQVQEGLKRLAPVEEEHRLLQEARRRLPQEKDDLERDTALAQRRELEIAQGEERVQSIKREIESLPAMETQLRAAEERHRDAQQTHATQQGRRAYLEERIKEARDLEAKQAELEAELRSLTQEREVYEQLTAAFGRGGVQAMLIEAAMPELEDEANRLLGRMTDNAMHLKLETQRATLRGETVETLQINVADELGTRSYDTFSGGEAFRINLALRIALSRLLAHRSGAPLSTLFIDEGFGTQDAQGRERILDVIQSIAEDFKCILVITHMEEMKEAFPVRIEVQKTASGSTFSIT
ncbi:MAG: SMC family ATPase, partial [Chloroflexi bacterium]|nr:SMC family ATPase [Chloroflexota bacterium]